MCQLLSWEAWWRLIAAIRAVAAGDARIAPAVTRRLLIEFVHRPRPGGAADALAALTER